MNPIKMSEETKNMVRAFEDIVDLAQQAEGLAEHWSPKVVGQINDQYLKVAKVHGEFPWHKHEEEDEMFLILRGSIDLEYEDRVVHLSAGQAHIVPRNTMHKPIAKEECLLALIEPVATKHTGELVTERTKSIADQLG
jgi:mannose-6-phosphate isomerase-like protein (cupin superfamily)